MEIAGERDREREGEREREIKREECDWRIAGPEQQIERNAIGRSQGQRDAF